MTEWIRKSEWVTSVDYRREFDYEGHEHWGFGFPCDADGNLIDDEHRDAWIGNYEACLRGEVDGRKVLDRGIERREYSYREPGVIRCDCGGEVELYMAMTNTCDTCGADYNLSGQRLAPREQWGWDTGESVSDILLADRRVDDPYAGMYIEEDEWA
jgi:hypothetical protein